MFCFLIILAIWMPISLFLREFLKQRNTQLRRHQTSSRIVCERFDHDVLCMHTFGTLHALFWCFACTHLVVIMWFACTHLVVLMCFACTNLVVMMWLACRHLVLCLHTFGGRNVLCLHTFGGLNVLCLHTFGGHDMFMHAHICWS